MCGSCCRRSSHGSRSMRVGSSPSLPRYITRGNRFCLILSYVLVISNRIWQSYGGHYGPEFAHYIQQQNEGIKRGLVKGEEINLVALGINNGWFDSGIQEKAYADFAYNNNYRRLINESQYESFLAAYYTKCLPAVQLCNLLRTNEACENADNICGSNIDNPISEAADFDVYDVRSPAEDPNPPSTYSSYLQQEGVVKAIGARVQYQECPDAPYDKFSKTGDSMFPLPFSSGTICPLLTMLTLFR